MARSLFFITLVVAAVMCQNVAVGANVTNVKAPPENLAVDITDHNHVVSVAQNAGLHADASVFLGTKFFNALDGVIDKVIDASLKNIANGLPRILDELHIAAIKLEASGDKHVSLAFEGPHDIVMRAEHFKIIVPKTEFHVLDVATFVCPGHFWATVEDVSATIRYTLGADGGSLKTSHVGTSVNYKKLDIQNRFEGTACNIWMTIHKLIIRLVDNLLDDALHNLLPRYIKPAAGINFQEKPFRLPLYFTEAPRSTNAGINTTVELLQMKSILRRDFQALAIENNLIDSSPELENAAVQRVTTRGGAQAGIDDRDVGMYLAAQSASSIIEAYYRTGLLNILDFGLGSNVFSTKNLRYLIPSVYAKCRDCALKFGIRWGTSPTVSFNQNKANLHVKQLSFGVNAVSASQETIPVFTTQLDATVGLNNFRTEGQNILFGLDASGIQFSSHLTDNKFGQALENVRNQLLNELFSKAIVPAFDKLFKGFPLLIPENFVITDPIVSPDANRLKVAFNVKQ